MTTLRVATRHDLLKLGEIAQDFTYLPFLNEKLSWGDFSIAAEVPKNKIAGYVCGCKTSFTKPTGEIQDCCQIFRLVVHDNYESISVWKTLIAALEERCISVHCYLMRMTLKVKDDDGNPIFINLKTIQMLGEVGFEIKSVRHEDPYQSDFTSVFKDIIQVVSETGAVSETADPADAYSYDTSDIPAVDAFSYDTSASATVLANAYSLIEITKVRADSTDTSITVLANSRCEPVVELPEEDGNEPVVEYVEDGNGDED